MTDVSQKLAAYPRALSERLCALRALILDIATSSLAIGTVDESLKWGQASFATTAPKSGTPIRMDGDAERGTYSVYVSCSTDIIESFRDLHPDLFEYHGNREIRLCLSDPLPVAELTLFLTAALRYYLDK